MKQLAADLQKKFSDRELREDEYRSETDGLIYCAKCHTPRQCRVEFLGISITPAVRCQCQQEAFDKEEALRKQREELERIARLKASGLQDQKLYDYCFANDSGINPEIRHAYTYVEQWPQMQKDGTGSLLWGDVGTGKSFIAGCIANALMEQGVPVLMTNFARILNTLTGMYSDDRNEFINSLNRYSLLIIDDLGMERNSEFAQEQVFHVIDSRYRSKKPLIVTTNLTLEEIKNPANLAWARIYDRILERCAPLKINNQNIRQQNAAVNLERMKQIFI